MGTTLDTYKPGASDERFHAWGRPGGVSSPVPTVIPRHRTMTIAEARAMPSVHHWLRASKNAINPASVWFYEMWTRPRAYSREDIERGRVISHEVKVRADWPDGSVFEYEAYFASLDGAMWGLEGVMQALSRGKLKRRTGRTIQAYAGPVREE